MMSKQKLLKEISYVNIKKVKEEKRDEGRSKERDKKEIS
jgi:hypothetical protein